MTVGWAQRMDRARAARLLRRPHATGEFIVQFRDPEATPATDDIARYARGGVRELQQLGEGRFHLLRTEGEEGAALEGLSEHPEIAYIEPNYVIRVEKTPGDPLFPQQWGLKSTTNADVAATAAWDYTTGGRKTVVAVIDTGVDYTHPDLTANVWSAPRSFTFNGANGVVTCPAGSRGVNAINSTCAPMDDNGHGTHCAGIIGASGENGMGVAGVNWTASILPIKFLNNKGSGLLSDALRAIDSVVQIKKQFGADANVRVISASWGFTGNSQALDAALAAANTADILFVAAAGNDSMNNDTTASYPANSTQPNVISVAATDRNDALATFSNYGSKVHLGAPGVQIGSTYLNGQYVNMSGTSMATPFVSGAAALVLSANTAALRQHLLVSVDAVPGLAGKTETGGRLNVYKAIRRCAVPAASLIATPASQTIKAGESASFSLLPSGVGGLSGSGTIAVTGAPAGVTVTVGSAVALGAAAPLNVTTLKTAAPGTYLLTATLTATAPTAPVAPGGSVSIGVTIARLNGFTGAVAIAPQGLPAGVTASSVTLASGQSAATIAVKIGATAAIGAVTVQLAATGGTTGLTATTTIKVSRTLTLAFGAAQYSVRAGGTASLPVTVSPNGAKAGALRFTLYGLLGPSAVGLTAGPNGIFLLTNPTPPSWAGKTTTLNLTVSDGALTAGSTAKLTITN